MITFGFRRLASPWALLALLFHSSVAMGQSVPNLGYDVEVLPDGRVRIDDSDRCEAKIAEIKHFWGTKPVIGMCHFENANSHTICSVVMNRQATVAEDCAALGKAIMRHAKTKTTYVIHKTGDEAQTDVVFSQAHSPPQTAQPSRTQTPQPQTPQPQTPPSGPDCNGCARTVH